MSKITVEIRDAGQRGAELTALDFERPPQLPGSVGGWKALQKGGPWFVRVQGEHADRILTSPAFLSGEASGVYDLHLFDDGSVRKVTT